jgi:hypothetical protein
MRFPISGKRARILGVPDYGFQSLSQKVRTIGRKPYHVIFENNRMI